MKESEKVEDLIAMLDDLMAGGTGHVNLICNDENGEVNVQTTSTTDCGCCDGKKSACAQPTELEIED